MKPNRMKADLKAGRTIHGTICTQGMADSAEIAARAGFDFVLIDWQHGGFNRETVREAARAVQTTDATPMARTSASWSVASASRKVTDHAMDLRPSGTPAPR